MAGFQAEKNVGFQARSKKIEPCFQDVKDDIYFIFAICSLFYLFDLSFFLSFFYQFSMEIPTMIG